VRLDGSQHRLSRADALALRDALTEATVGREQFLRTAGEHRADGSYVVSRVSTDSTGHRKVFERFADLQELFDRLPAQFTASELQAVAADCSGGRCHLLVRHFAEHPAFDCELVSRQPLTVEKVVGSAGDSSSDHPCSSDDTAQPTDDDSVCQPEDGHARRSEDGHARPADD
jgi:hypothetical protein